MCHLVKVDDAIRYVKRNGHVTDWGPTAENSLRYSAEAQFKYNDRFNDDIFGTAIEGA